VRDLNAKGINATMDHLGENTTNAVEAAQATADIERILDEIDCSGGCANVSIKLTQIGLALDESMCHENLRRVLEHARLRNNFVRIDMEGSPYTEKTLDLYRQMRAQGF